MPVQHESHLPLKVFDVADWGDRPVRSAMLHQLTPEQLREAEEGKEALKLRLRRKKKRGHPA